MAGCLMVCAAGNRDNKFWAPAIETGTLGKAVVATATDGDGHAAAGVVHAGRVPAMPRLKGYERPSIQEALLSSFDLAGVAELIASGRAQRIVVMAGAGISVSAGIPDFRSPGTGLYSQLQRFNLPWPEAVFDLRYFRHDPKPFCMLAKELWPGVHRAAPTPTHHFLRLLHDKGLLLTAFTQNIDGLEGLAGLPGHKVVHAHGSFDGAHCIDCKRPTSSYAVQADVFDDEVPTCETCGGLVKPDITFFGEALPVNFHRRRLSDLQEADLLIVLGTSLLVQPFAGMIDQVPADTPRVLINLTRAGEKQQQQPQPSQQQQQLVCGPACRRAGCMSRSTSSSSIDDEEDNREDSSSGSGGGGVSDDDVITLTASNSMADVSSCCCCNDDSDKQQPSAVDAGSNGTGGSSGSNGSKAGGGFDFGRGYRDVLHLGDCDSAVMQLADLLGWQQELQALVEAGQAAYEEARSCWEE